MDRATPSPFSNALFRAKVLALQAQRAYEDATVRPKKFEKTQELPPDILADLTSKLWRELDPREGANERGKVHNLRLAAKQLDRIRIPAGQVFSFWKQLGRTTNAKGYVYGRQIQEGCLIPALGGGICQLTNMLYEAALNAGFEIVERHPHTRKVPGAPANKPDATVAWNHIDLRFRPLQDVVLKVFLTADELHVQFLGEKASKLLMLPLIQERPAKGANSCVTCGMEECFRHKVVEVRAGRTAVLVDRVWPEYAAYLAEQDLSQDLLLLPLDPRRIARPAYKWPVERCGKVHAATLDTLYRSWKSRKLAGEGAARRKAGLESDEALAKAYARHLGSDVVRLVVQQQFLPFLWRDGHLGGRHFEVLMARLPMVELQRRLDEAASKDPSRKSLSDFRAGNWMLEAERAALEQADRIITPHTEIAKLYPDKTTLLPWTLPSAKQVTRGDAIAFPGPAIARKGSDIVRKVAKELNLPVILAGSDLEPPGFWSGIDLRLPTPAAHWLTGAAFVLQPAVMEDQPRKLLEALSCAVPVIATTACGLPPMAGLELVETQDCDRTVLTLARWLAKDAHSRRAGPGGPA